MVLAWVENDTNMSEKFRLYVKKYTLIIFWAIISYIDFISDILIKMLNYILLVRVSGTSVYVRVSAYM